MNDFQSFDLIWLVGGLVLILSAFSLRRVPLGFVVRSILAWAAIIVVVVVAVAHRHEIAAVVASATATLGIDEQQVEGRTVRIRMSPDGHFWARVTINGVARRMLIDSGATITAISAETAAATEVEPGAGLPAIIETANGTVTAQRGRIQRLTIGPLETENLGVVVSPSFGEMDVLGMNFLSRLHSWRVENRTLVLEPTAETSSDGSDATGSALEAVNEEAP